ncbi:hypothetical protein J5N97_005095 [Dioscorea zingiberensis]|uniref:Uncharacterized protein n=1 Tax=Dioscorea zingiberensis TaxID=325984 RepID=A0A9D5D963_9LILI|nr:hypothetical protein J5N97_005095 [Dioscorea zingiberensis]
MSTSWEVFRTTTEKYPGNKMLGWREFTNGNDGPYLWKTYKEIYEEVLKVGSTLKQLGVEPDTRIGVYGVNCPQWACNGYGLICVPLYDTLGAGAVDYIIEHAEIEFVFVQDKKVKQEVPENLKLEGLLFDFLVTTTRLTTEFSGFLLYKELGRRLKKTNPVVAEIFSLMSRDEARHARVFLISTWHWTWVS